MWRPLTGKPARWIGSYSPHVGKEAHFFKLLNHFSKVIFRTGVLESYLTAQTPAFGAGVWRLNYELDTRILLAMILVVNT